MHRIFISGPITPRGRRTDCDGHPAVEYIFNVRDMVLISNALMVKGWAPYCPGTDFFNFLLSTGKQQLIKKVFAVDLAWLEASDAILMMPGWETSPGSCGEYSRAVELEMPIFYSVTEVPAELHAEQRSIQ